MSNRQRNMKRRTNSTFRAYRSLLRSDQDFDYAFLLKLERKKMQRMAAYFSESNLTETDAATAKELSLCVRLLDVVLGDDEAHKKWTDEIVRRDAAAFLSGDDGYWNYHADSERQEPIPDFPEYVNLRNASRFVPPTRFPKKSYASEEERKSWTECFKEDIRKAKAWHLYHLVREYKMLGWWN